jgi:hypothetical protein
MFNKFPDIGGFHNVRRSVGDRVTRVKYRGKIKLHGSNAAIRFNGKNIFAQSRSRTITVGDDNMGFARWVEDNREAISLLVNRPKNTSLTIFGEWCGQGIMSGVAISGIGRKVFAIFAVQLGDSDDETAVVVTEPDDIAKFINISYLPDVYILPWATDVIEIDFTDSNQMNAQVEFINEVVTEIEVVDPWVDEMFGVKGTGEGLVFVPLPNQGSTIERFKYSSLTFKAKGEKHRVTKQKVAVQIDPEVVRSIEQFVDVMVTPARLEQGVREVSKGEIVFNSKLIGPFIGWVCKDIKKESTAELDAAGLEWNQVTKAVTNSARKWYMKKLDES